MTTRNQNHLLHQQEERERGDEALGKIRYWELEMNFPGGVEVVYGRGRKGCGGYILARILKKGAGYIL